jgi:hypothetical protein
MERQISVEAPVNLGLLALHPIGRVIGTWAQKDFFDKGEQETHSGRKVASFMKTSNSIFAFWTHVARKRATDAREVRVWRAVRPV